MKVIAAYLLAVLGGNACPTAGDVKHILGSGSFCFTVNYLMFFCAWLVVLSYQIRFCLFS